MKSTRSQPENPTEIHKAVRAGPIDSSNAMHEVYSFAAARQDTRNMELLDSSGGGYETPFRKS
jgi:hypothetical protein